MRRYFSLACVALVVIMCMVSPVHASMVNNSIFINLLDYSFPNNGDSRFVSVNSGDVVTFDLPEECIVDYVEALVVITDNVPSSISCATQSNYYNLSVEQVDGSLYRLYGYLDGFSTEQLKMKFVTSHSYLIFQSVKIATASLELHPVAFEGTGYYPGGSFDMSKNFGDNRPTKTLITNSDFDNRDFTLFLESQDWKKYDFIEYQLSFIVDDITSISCVMGPDNIPIDVSYYDNSTSDSYIYLTISIDCRYLDRTSEDFPMVIIMGSVVYDGASSIQLMNSNGIVVLNDVNPLFYYFNKVGDWISNQTALISSALSSHFSNLNTWIDDQTGTIEQFFSWYFTNLNDNIYDRFSSLNTWIDEQTNRLESAIRGDTAPGDSFQQEVDQKDQQLNDMAAVMDSVNKPQIDSVNVSADSYVDQTVLATSMSGLTAVISMPVFLDVIMMALIMATAGYVLFGKR